MYGGRQGRSSTSLFFLFILVSAAVCLYLLCPLCLRSLIADSTNGMCSMSFYVYAMWLLRHKGHIMRHNYTAAEAKTNRKNNDGSSYLVFRHTSRAICYTICVYVIPNYNKNIWHFENTKHNISFKPSLPRLPRRNPFAPPSTWSWPKDLNARNTLWRCEVVFITVEHNRTHYNMRKT